VQLLWRVASSEPAWLVVAGVAAARLDPHAR
jgi:hypothetical protein